MSWQRTIGNGVGFGREINLMNTSVVSKEP